MLKRNKKFIIALFLLSGMCGFALSLYLHRQSQQTINPDDVQMVQTFHTPALFVKQITGDPDAGRKIYKEFCVSCHASNPIIDVKAPSIDDKAAWQARRKLGMKKLLETTIQGKGAMPARGGCFECSDEQLRMTIHYMLGK